MNIAPITVQEEASVSVSLPFHSSKRCLNPFVCTNTTPNHLQRCYQVFRTLGLKFLPVVNRHNQVVGTITRTDLSADALAHSLVDRGNKKCD